MWACRDSPWLLVIFSVLWGNALISFCFFLATFFSQTRTASIVGYLLSIVGVGVSTLLNFTVFLADAPPVW